MPLVVIVNEKVRQPDRQTREASTPSGFRAGNGRFCSSLPFPWPTHFAARQAWILKLSAKGIGSHFRTGFLSPERSALAWESLSIACHASESRSPSDIQPRSPPAFRFQMGVFVSHMVCSDTCCGFPLISPLIISRLDGHASRQSLVPAFFLGQVIL